MPEYNSSERVELIVKDYSGAKIDIFRWSIDDKNSERKIFSILRRKYGIFNNQPQANKDLDWLRKKDGFY